VLGYAAYTAVIAGLGSFGPTFVYGLGLFKDQATCSLVFGAVVSVGGAIGTPAGGWWLDRGQRAARAREKEALAAAAAASGDGGGPGPGGGAVAAPDSDEGAAAGDEDDPSTASPDALDAKLCVALPQCVAMMVVGSLLVVGGTLCGTTAAPAFFALLAAGASILCATTAGVNLAIMASVPPENRAFAIGLGTMLTHALGDVPAPPLIGALADALSPSSCPDGADGVCTRSAAGLERTLALTEIWLVWPVLMWAAAWALAARRRAARAASAAAGAGPRASMGASSGTRERGAAAGKLGGGLSLDVGGGMSDHDGDGAGRDGEGLPLRRGGGNGGSGLASSRVRLVGGAGLDSRGSASSSSVRRGPGYQPLSLGDEGDESGGGGRPGAGRAGGGRMGAGELA
jgi:hypothetical protein